MSINVSFEGMPVSMEAHECCCLQGGVVDPTCLFCGGSGRHVSEYGIFEVDLSNGNFFYLFRKVLGLEVDYCGTMNPEVLLTAIRSSLARQLPETAAVETKVHKQEGQCTIIECGVDREYIQRRLEQLNTLALEARRRGKLVNWG
jgi:hypothetical protein